MNKILVVSLEKRFKKFEKSVEVIAKKTLRILKKDNTEVEIYLAGSRKMRFLNKKFRSKNKAASILSFSEPKRFIYPDSRHKRIGEIYLKLPTTNYSITQLLTHGLLHLFGYSHKKKNDRIKMERKEKLVIRTLKTILYFLVLCILPLSI